MGAAVVVAVWLAAIIGSLVWAVRTLDREQQRAVEAEQLQRDIDQYAREADFHRLPDPDFAWDVRDYLYDDIDAWRLP